MKRARIIRRLGVSLSALLALCGRDGLCFERMSEDTTLSKIKMHAEF